MEQKFLSGTNWEAVVQLVSMMDATSFHNMPSKVLDRCCIYSHQRHCCVGIKSTFNIWFPFRRYMDGAHEFRDIHTCACAVGL